MNDKFIRPISSVQASGTNTHNKMTDLDKTAHGIVRENHSVSVSQAMRDVENRMEKATNLSNTSIHFNVDEETNRLIVVVTDRQTGRIIRTIPTCELEKLQAGDLLKITA